MASHGGESRSDAEIIGQVSIPAESRVPDAATGAATPTEYDLYFRILRGNPGLLEWSRSCLETHAGQIRDLDHTSLTAEEKCEILQGMLLVQRVTLKKWVTATEAALSSEVSSA